MKNNIKSAAFAILSVCLLLILFGCGGKGEMSDIYISDSNRPVTEYLEGEELDLLVGSIGFTVGGKDDTRGLCDEGVSVTGYDKNKLGEQTLTVTYKGKSTEYTVTVLARAEVQNFVRDYFVGEKPDLSKGSLLIRQSASFATLVDLDDPSITVTGFDTSRAGTNEISVSYLHADGAEYSASFTVTVREIGRVDFTPPEKISYESHETALSVEGGYFTLTAKDDESVKKNVPIDPETVRGFDPSLAGAEHRTEPLVETLTVKYGELSFEYQISVYYSPAFFINDCALKLVGKSFDAATEEEKELAVYATNIYFSLSEDERSLVDRTTLCDCVKIAAHDLTEALLFECEKLSESFSFNEKTGELSILLPSVQRLASDGAVLKDAESEFNLCASLLRKIKAEFGSLASDGDTSLGEYIKVPTEENVLILAEASDVLRMIYEGIKDVPKNWTASALSNYKSGIVSAAEAVLFSEHLTADVRDIYAPLHAWLDGTSAFEVIYSYYYNIKFGGKDTIKDELWKKLPMPAELGDWYGAYRAAEREIALMQGKDPELYSTSDLMYYYFEAQRLAEKIKAEGSPLYRGIYSTLGCDILMKTYLEDTACGYLEHAKGILDSDKLSSLAEVLLSIVTIDKEGLLDPIAHRELLCELFDGFLSLSPSDAYRFISYAYYPYRDTDTRIFESSCDSLARYLVDFYGSELSDELKDTVKQLLSAIENYSVYLTRGDSSALDLFKLNITAVSSAYKSLTDSDKEFFARNLDSCYGLYLDICNALDSDREPSYGVLEDAANELKETLTLFFKVHKFINGKASEDEKRESYMLLFSLYERARELYTVILSSADNATRVTLFTEIFDFDGETANTDAAFVSAREIFVSYMTATLILDTDDGSVLYDSYRDSEVREFLAYAAPVMKYEFFGTPIDKELLVAISSSLRELDKETQNVFLMIGCAIYYDGLESYYHALYEGDEALSALSTLILETEYAYLTYMQAEDSASALTVFAEKAESTKTNYAALSDPDALDGYLYLLMEHYLGIYESMTK